MKIYSFSSFCLFRAWLSFILSLFWKYSNLYCLLAALESFLCVCLCVCVDGEKEEKIRTQTNELQFRKSTSGSSASFVDSIDGTNKSALSCDK